MQKTDGRKLRRVTNHGRSEPFTRLIQVLCAAETAVTERSYSEFSKNFQENTLYSCRPTPHSRDSIARKRGDANLPISAAVKLGCDTAPDLLIDYVVVSLRSVFAVGWLCRLE